MHLGVQGIAGLGVARGQSHPNSLARNFRIQQEGGRGKWMLRVQATKCYGKIVQLP